MKRKISLLLAVVLVVTMVMGMRVQANAATYDVEMSITMPTHADDPIAEAIAVPAGSYSKADGIILAEENPVMLGWCSKESSENPGVMPVGDSYYLYNPGSHPDTSKEYYYLFQVNCNRNTGTLSVCVNGLPYTAYNIGEIDEGISAFVGVLLIGKVDDDGNIIPPEDPDPENPKPETPSSPTHVHNFQWQTITEPTSDADGLEAEVCSICGERRNEQPLSAYGYVLNQYAAPMINAAQPGQTITFEFGEWNSFPKSFMEKIAAKNGATYVFKFKYNHQRYTVCIPAGTKVDLNEDWYGPLKLAELYGAIVE